MNTSKFGPVAWSVLQSLPCTLESSTFADRTARESLLIVLSSLAVVLPCRYCRLSYRQFMVRVNLQDWLQTPARVSSDQVAQWLFLVHNEVNRKLNKTVYSRRDDVYDKCVLHDERQFMAALVEWFYILWTAVSDREQEQRVALRVPSAAHNALVRDGVERSNGKALCEANECHGTIGGLLHHWIGDMYAKYFYDGHQQLDQWRKYAWNVLHMAHLLRLLKRANWSSAAQRALDSMYEALTTEWHTSQTVQDFAKFMLKATHQAYIAYDAPAARLSFDATMTRIGQRYRVVHS